MELIIKEIGQEKKLPKKYNILNVAIKYRYNKEGTYSMIWTHQGRTHTRKHENPRIALDEMEDLILSIRRGKNPQIRNLTFDAVFESYLNDYKTRVKETTFNKQAKLARLWLKPLFGMNMDNITREVLRNMVTEWTQNTATPRALHHLESIYEYAVVEKMVTDNPSLRLPNPPVIKKKDKRKMYFRDDEIKTMLETFLSSKSPNREICALFFKFSILTACRRGEILGVTFEDIDYEKRRIRIDKGTGPDNQRIGVKTESSERYVPLCRSLEKDLKNIPVQSGKIFDLTYRQIGSFFQFQNYKFDFTFTIHCFRHHSISYLSEKGMSETLIAQIAGHKKSTSITQHYIHSLDDPIEKALKILDKIDLPAVGVGGVEEREQ